MIDRLGEIIDNALLFDGNSGVAPVALLWPDENCQWMSLIPRLRQSRRIVSLGDFDPQQGVGPAYWIRCVVASTTEMEESPQGIPIVYLPGISRDRVRSDEKLDDSLMPLVGLQHRSNWFTHPNGRDWTVRGLLSNRDNGFGLNIANDDATSRALLASLTRLGDEPLSRLETRFIDAAFLNGLLSPDPTRSLLTWLDNPSVMKKGLLPKEWEAFVEQCQHDFGFNPNRDGELEGVLRLADASTSWSQVWRRFAESPADFPGIVDRLRQVQPAEFVYSNPGAWPGVADAAEEQLRRQLSALIELSPGDARLKIRALEAENEVRRSYVWATLGRTPLVMALEHLAVVAELSARNIQATSVNDLEVWYSNDGWQVDADALLAVAEVEETQDVKAVSLALDAVYRPWLDDAARSMQSAVGPSANAGTYFAGPTVRPLLGEVLVFVDGLRLDVAHLLKDRLSDGGLEVSIAVAKAALPTVTQTSKPTLIPIDQGFLSAGTDLDARRAPDGPVAGVQVLRSLMISQGVQVLSTLESGESSGIGWTEAGQIDHYGHNLGVMFAHEVRGEVQRIASRVESLIQAGWSKVTVVTDHGWLFLPSGLPKNEDLPASTTETKKGRCARIKTGAIVNLPTVPWHWDKDVRIAIAPGVTCFEANRVYEHGGVSPQECIVPQLAVKLGSRSVTVGAAITSSKWRGLTLVVEFVGLPDGSTVDLRTVVGDGSSSIAEVGRVTGGQGKVMLLVVNEDLEGQTAQLVVVAADQTLLLQREVIVGQNR